MVLLFAFFFLIVTIFTHNLITPIAFISKLLKLSILINFLWCFTLNTFNFNIVLDLRCIFNFTEYMFSMFLTKISLLPYHFFSLTCSTDYTFTSSAKICGYIKNQIVSFGKRYFLFTFNTVNRINLFPLLRDL